MKTVTINILIPEKIDGLMWVSDQFIALVKTEALKTINAQQQESKRLSQMMEISKIRRQ